MPFRSTVVGIDCSCGNRTASHGSEGVDEHQYHGLVYVCVHIRKCAPGNDTTSVNKDNREGELRVVTPGVYR